MHLFGSQEGIRRAGRPPHGAEQGRCATESNAKGPLFRGPGMRVNDKELGPPGVNVFAAAYPGRATKLAPHLHALMLALAVRCVLWEGPPVPYKATVVTGAQT